MCNTGIIKCTYGWYKPTKAKLTKLENWVLSFVADLHVRVIERRERERERGFRLLYIFLSLQPNILIKLLKNLNFEAVY